MSSHVCAHTHTQTHAHQRGGRTPGAFWAQKAPALGSQHPWALMGKLRPIHRCEFLTAGEQRAATQAFPPAPRAALLRSSWKASLWICKYFNSQKLQGVGAGAGVACWPSLSLYPGLFQPPWWQQHSRDMQWCASTIHTTRTGHGWPQGQAVGGGCGSSQSGPCHRAGEAGPLTGSAQPQGREGTGAQPL